MEKLSGKGYQLQNLSGVLLGTRGKMKKKAESSPQTFSFQLLVYNFFLKEYLVLLLSRVLMLQAFQRPTGCKIMCTPLSPRIASFHHPQLRTGAHRLRQALCQSLKANSPSSTRCFGISLPGISPSRVNTGFT